MLPMFRRLSLFDSNGEHCNHALGQCSGSDVQRVVRRPPVGIDLNRGILGRSVRGSAAVATKTTQNHICAVVPNCTWRVRCESLRNQPLQRAQRLVRQGGSSLCSVAHELRMHVLGGFRWAAHAGVALKITVPNFAIGADRRLNV